MDYANLDSRREPMRKLIAGGLPALLFVAYPLALLAPSGIGVFERFHFALPVGMLAGLAAALLLAVGRFETVGGRQAGRARRLQVGVLAVLLLALLPPFLSDRFLLPEILRFAGLFSVVFWFALARRAWLPRRLAGILLALWLLHFLHLTWDLLGGRQPVGLAGNRNWMASLALALVPWAWLAIADWAGGTPVDSWRRRLAAAACPLVGLATALGLWFAQSRAAWLLLFAYGLWFLLFRVFSSTTRVFAVALLVFGGLAMFAQNPQMVRELDADGVRLPIWRSSLAMAGENALFGVGPGNFRREFPKYRLPEQMASPKAAPVTDHPHNELLHIAASLGLPMALLWSLLLTPLLLPPPAGRGLRAAHFSAFVLIGHGMLDLTLAQPPTSLLALICLGLLWRPHIHARIALPGRRRPVGETYALRTPQWVLAAGALVLGLFLTYRETGGQWLMRQGAVAEGREDWRTAYQAYVQAGRWTPGDVRPFAYAGNLALYRFDEPKAALDWFVVAALREPDFGHINGHIGLALVRLGEVREALPFWVREAAFFPFDPLAQDNLLTGKLTVGEFDGTAELVERAIAARRQTLLHRRPENETKELIGVWRRALADGDRQTALKAAHLLTAPVLRGGRLPNSDLVLAAAALPEDYFDHRFRELDALYWQWLIDGVELGSPGRERELWGAVRLLERKRLEAENVALLLARDSRPQALLIDRGEVAQLLGLNDRASVEFSLAQGEDAEFDCAVWADALRELSVETAGLRLAVPTGVWQVAERHRVLAMVLHGYGADDILPLPLPPAYRLEAWRSGRLSPLLEASELSVELLPMGR